jgi:hypothetical protein
MGDGDHSAFAGFARRILRAYARRVAGADVEDLAELLELRQDVDDAIAAAVAGMRERGVSWAAIATATGTTRQAAQQRYTVKAPLTPERADGLAPGEHPGTPGREAQRAAHSPLVAGAA